jgi:RNA polymerase sigma-70 factor, ECF subfamily
LFGYGTANGSSRIRPFLRRHSTLSVEYHGLAVRASQGDVAAFRRLVQDHSALVYRVALRILGATDAQDASQEVWVRVWRSIGRFRGESAFSTWLYRITVNTCLTVRRTESRRGEREQGEEMPYLFEPSGGDADPEAVALSAERRAEIQAALGHVRAEHRAALVLRHMEGLSYAEIAEVMDVPDGTAKGWVSRGRAAMLVAMSNGAAPSLDRNLEENGG